uniref:Reverse transcriptase zinc-binding domain-containing protein n=1 Tax=Quercus lobata TaxID=97700 RepID=A0A7N2LLU9_QUELO
MGFRDIHAFNLAMLPKQACRLVTGSHSLFYRVYKARYFPGCSFMDAKLGHNPSFVWRSLLAARDVIRATFMQATQNDILRLQLSNTRARDRLYWKENKAQQFTVKTAYQVALRLNREVGVEHSTVGEEKRFWNRIWRMNVPPKVRNFVWRACTGILPTRANLYRRRVPIDPLLNLRTNR